VRRKAGLRPAKIVDRLVSWCGGGLFPCRLGETFISWIQEFFCLQAKAPSANGFS